ncbi:MAG: hypothetical protein Hyperionvirus11_39 [Hyperionvirus sp.]|uniref:Uncharacterized protein n=1 Tax=Hyperionvirus sp. TaxID=2487770 RepID=A0A3G5A912_9VIRU|nr:MAG: hypothetical protein Hyperionvirus11_39 [Hyperionvirus sp.]
MEKLLRIPELRKRYFELFHVGEAKKEYYGSPVILANHIDFEEDDETTDKAPSKNFSPLGFLRSMKEGTHVHLLMHDRDILPEFDIVWSMITSINSESELESKWNLSLTSIITSWKYIKYFNIRYTDAIFLSWIKVFWHKFMTSPEYMTHASEIIEIIQVGLAHTNFIGDSSQKQFSDLATKLDKFFLVKYNKRSLLFLQKFVKNIEQAIHVKYDPNWNLTVCKDTIFKSNYSYKKYPIHCSSIANLIRTYILAGEIQIVNSEDFKAEIASEGKTTVANIEWQIDIETINCCVDELIAYDKEHKLIKLEEMKRIKKFYNLPEDTVKYAISIIKINSEGYEYKGYYAVHEILQYGTIVKRATQHLPIPQRLNVHVDSKSHKFEVTSIIDYTLQFYGIQTHSIIELVSILANSKHAKFIFDSESDIKPDKVAIRTNYFSISEFKYLLEQKKIDISKSTMAPSEIFREISLYSETGIFSFTENDKDSMYDASGIDSDGFGVIAISDLFYEDFSEFFWNAYKYNFCAILNDKFMLALYMSGAPMCIRFDSKYFIEELNYTIEQYNKLSIYTAKKYLKDQRPILASILTENQPEPDDPEPADD